MTANCETYVVVAHPDDELWLFGGALLDRPAGIPTTIVYCSDGGGERAPAVPHDTDIAKLRRARAEALCLSMGWSFVWLGIPDRGREEHLDQGVLDRRVSKVLSTLDSQCAVWTHGPLGEYMHPHHIQVALATARARLGVLHYHPYTNARHLQPVSQQKIYSVREAISKAYPEQAKPEIVYGAAEWIALTAIARDDVESLATASLKDSVLDTGVARRVYNSVSPIPTPSDTYAGQTQWLKEHSPKNLRMPQSLSANCCNLCGACAQRVPGTTVCLSALDAAYGDGLWHDGRAWYALHRGLAITPSTCKARREFRYAIRSNIHSTISLLDRPTAEHLTFYDTWAAQIDSFYGPDQFRGWMCEQPGSAILEFRQQRSLIGFDWVIILNRFVIHQTLPWLRSEVPHLRLGWFAVHTALKKWPEHVHLFGPVGLQDRFKPSLGGWLYGHTLANLL